MNRNEALRCPNCGVVYEEEDKENGWRSVTISTSTVLACFDDEPGFWGQEHWCSKCDHKWRVPFEVDNSSE